MLTLNSIRKHSYLDKEMWEWVCIAYLELPEVRLVLSVSRNRNKAIAARECMKNAHYRFSVGPQK